jgi:hypothetical protein
LEVLDWGGKGRVLLLIAGLGNTAHVYDAFAARLIDKYHVIGIRVADLALPAGQLPVTVPTGWEMTCWQ